MPRCDGDDEEYTVQDPRCEAKCIPNFAANKACITRRGVEEDFEPPPPGFSAGLEGEDCPACGSDSDETGSDDDDSDDDGRRGGRRRQGRGRSRRRRRRYGQAYKDYLARRDAARYQPWTPYYIGTVMLEKLASLVALSMYIYSDNYRWSLFKSFIFFTTSIKSMFTLADVIKKECERRQRCLDAAVFYSK